MVNEPGNEVL